MTARRRTFQVLVGLVVVHLGLCVARIPGKAYGKRLRQIDEHNRSGVVRYHLDNGQRQGADAVEWLIERTPEHCVILWRGAWHGSFEFAAAALAPRLLVFAGKCPPGQQSLDGLPPIARGEAPDGTSGQFVLVAHEKDLEVLTR